MINGKVKISCRMSGYIVLKHKVLIVISMMLFAVNIYSSAKWDTLINTGIDDFKKGQYNFAITNLKKFILLTDDEINKPRALYYLSLSYYFEGQYNQAQIYIDELNSMYRSSEFAAQSHFWLGLINQNSKKWNEAEQDFQRFIKLMPGSELSDKAYLAAANCQFEQKKYDDTLQTLGRLVTNEKSEKFEEGSVLFAYILLKKKDYDSALSFLEKWEKRLGNDGGKYNFKDRFWLYLSEIYIQKNDDENAYRLLKKIDNNAPGSSSSDIALLKLSEIEYRSGNVDIAGEYIKRLRIEYPDSIYNIDALLNTGIIFFDNKDYDKALDNFNAVSEMSSKKLAKTKNLDEIDRISSVRSRSLLYQSEVFARISSIKESNKALQMILDEKLPFKEEAVLKMLELAFETKEISKAEKLINKYESSLEKSHLKARYNILYGRYLFATEKYTEAIDFLKNTKPDDKYYFNALSLLVKCYTAKGEFKKGAALLKEILPKIDIKQRPSVISSLMSLNFNAAEYQEVIELEEIAAVYLKNLTISERISANINFLYLTGLSYIQLKNYDKGISTLKELQLLKDEKNLIDDDRIIINNSFYYLAWSYYKKSSYKEAASNFAAAALLMKEKEFKQDALFMEGFSYYSSSSFIESSVRFQKLFDTYYPETIALKGLFYTAKSYQNNGDITKATAIYNKIYSNLGNNQYRADSLYELIIYSLNNKKIEEANDYINEFGEKFAENPLYPGVLVLQMESFLAQERYSEVLSSALNYLNKYGNNEKSDKVYYWAGLSSMKIKDYETGLSSFTKIIDSYKNSPFTESALKNMIEIYKINSEYKKEFDTIGIYLLRFKDNGEYAKRNIVLEKILSGVSEEEAILVTASNQGDNEAKFKLAKMYYMKGDKDQGLKLIDEILKNDTGIYGAVANNFLGDIEYKNEQYKESLVIYAATISKFKGDIDTNSEALYKIAYCYYKLGKDEQALKYIEILKNKYPTSRWVLNADALKGSLR